MLTGLAPATTAPRPDTMPALADQPEKPAYANSEEDVPLAAEPAAKEDTTPSKEASATPSGKKTAGSKRKHAMFVSAEDLETRAKKMQANTTGDLRRKNARRVLKDIMVKYPSFNTEYEDIIALITSTDRAVQKNIEQGLAMIFNKGTTSALSHVLDHERDRLQTHWGLVFNEDGSASLPTWDFFQGYDSNG